MTVNVLDSKTFLIPLCGIYFVGVWFICNAKFKRQISK